MIELDENVTKEMNKYLDGTTIEEIIYNNRNMFHFPAVFTGTQLDQDIEVLDLGNRAYNCLRRSGTNTLRDLITKNKTTEEESSKKQLKRNNRNLGVKTADEILIKLFYYSFRVQPESKKKAYMQKVIESNISD
ncbi:MAG: hypothetical protein IJ065_12435 [Eubacterium sp.]|nr:hypothetical protein [Eubacterium sp.]